ncbi:MAG: DUF2849 domain-containing protein [Alphaproteobacteria bacterium]|nr:DUF2849 domain-containing protein [Alphaproteobacteria bacterium]
MSATHSIVTANDLRDGSVRYLRAEPLPSWERDIRRASTTADPATRDAWLALAEAEARANNVVAPYVIAVASGEGEPDHDSVRERVRASGPTTGNSLRRAP